MTKNKQPSASRARLADAMIEDMLAMSDEEMLAEFKEAGGDPVKNASDMRAAFEHRMLVANKRRMQAAKAGLEAAPPLPRRSAPLPSTTARQRLHQALASCPSNIKMTLAARKENELSDADVISMLEDLEELGLIQDGTKNGET